MPIRHHISDQLLMAYSAGQLPEAFSLVMAVHLSMCDDCKARLGAFDAVGGVVMDRCDEVAMDTDSLAATLAKLDMPLMGTHSPVMPRVQSSLPAPLADYIGGDLSAVKWRSLGAGVRQAILPTDNTASARLLYIPAGTAVPDHGHRGTELTLVLQGAFYDEIDRFGPGDLEISDEDINHQPIAEAGETCICLAATDAPLRFNALVPRLLQPFFRI
jgi:putative transcriptional regulator